MWAVVSTEELRAYENDQKSTNSRVQCGLCKYIGKDSEHVVVSSIFDVSSAALLVSLSGNARQNSIYGNYSLLEFLPADYK